MKVLWVATKPPWPPIDGGRVLMWYTLAALAHVGVDLTLVAPADRDADRRALAELQSFCRPILVPVRHQTRAWSFARALAKGAPFTSTHHRLDRIRDQVATLLSNEAFDLVHAEHAHAIANCEPALVTKVPVIFRAQNVESDLWESMAARRVALGPLLLREARRHRAWEAEALQRSDAAVALTKRDAERLRMLTNRPGDVHHIAAPFPSELAPSESCQLRGEPAVVLFGSSRWAPTSDGARWFIGKIWPTISNRLPNAVLHVFGGLGFGSSRANVVHHAAPRESSEAFAPGAILVVPLRIASGVRIKILEAWARSIPVIATREAAEGLEAAYGSELMIAKDAIEFANSIERFHRQRGLRESVTSRAHKKLRAEHDPASIAEHLVAVYRSALTTPKGR
ncbi:MAG: glycosyltransferase [Candidatus Binataceae bacterium]